MRESSDDVGGREGSPRPPEPCDDYGPAYFENYSRLRLSPEDTAPPYRWGEPVWEESFGRIASEILTRLKPLTVLDAGCAIGFLVGALRARGVAADGVDVSAWAISQVAEQVRPYCRVSSLTEDFGQDYDLICCIEVLEHLPPQETAAAVANLCRHADAVLFSSTPDHFDEVTHLNVRPSEYWVGLFACHGFYRDVDFDPSFISPQAILFRSMAFVPAVVSGYERWAWWSHHELVEVRKHRDKLYAEVWRARQDASEAEAELAALRSTKTFRFTRRLRALWAKTRRRAE